MRQANGIGTAPWDELELNNPVQLGHRLVGLFPVAVQAHHLVVELVDHQDVRCHLALAVLVVFQLKVGVDVVDLTQTVFVVFVLLTFDLVVGLLDLALLNRTRGLHHVDVAVHTAGNTSIELPMSDLVYLSRTLGGVEVCCRERQDHSVDWQELNAWALLLLVEPQLEIL